MRSQRILSGSVSSKQEENMKRFIGIAGLFTVVALTGCGEGKPGGPGVTDTTVKKPVYGQKEDTFNLSVPMMATSLQQGATLETKVGIERAKNFGEDVSLKFFDLPAGVTVTPSGPIIKHGDENAKIMFTADATAAKGEHKVKVFGHPQKGPDAEIEFKLNIEAMDSFSLSVPLLSTSIKQNETKAISIGISRDKTFASDVTLSFGELPPGITMEPSESIIVHGAEEAKVNLTAAADAALGDFTIKMAGHSATGLDASKELKLTVVKE
jgi:hypothetical protein